jgi:hypothetical protein
MFLPLLANIPGLNLQWNNSVSMQERILANIPARIWPTLKQYRFNAGKNLGEEHKVNTIEHSRMQQATWQGEASKQKAVSNVTTGERAQTTQTTWQEGGTRKQRVQCNNARKHRASNMTGRGRARTTWSTRQGGGRKHAREQNTTSNKTGRGRVRIKTGRKKTNANNTPNATGGHANSSTKRDNQTKNTAICTKNETQWFCSWEGVLALAVILVRGRSCWQNGCLLWFVSSGRKKPYLTLNYQFLHRNINFAKSWQKTLFLVSKFGCKFCWISYL